MNQNDVNHKTKNEIDTSYKMDDHHISNTLGEVADDKVRITINGISIHIVFNYNIN